MNERGNTFKIVLVSALVAVVTLFHYAAISEDLGLHLFHRELYFIPIVLASFWFGLKLGLATSVVVSIVYAPHVFIYDDAHGALLIVSSQILVFNFVAVVLGWLVDRRTRQHQEALILENEAVLGRAAAAVGHEMKDLMGALKGLTHKGERLQCTELDRDFEQEITRLEGMVGALSSLVPSEHVRLISRDLNAIINERLEHHRTTAQKAGVALEVRLDGNGCPTRTDVEKIGWILDKIINNAIEASTSGQTIQISSHRGGTFCQVRIQDQGSGIPAEDLSKIFTPFFTTKDTGHGLALAVSKKIMRDLGGDLLVESQWGEGATFTVTVPREHEPKSFS
ncbi:MAG: histidine kinase [Deltaproteobacteria bacterium]|nr:MAG: histidine kinase [Deltaproteobacteria bacterium]